MVYLSGVGWCVLANAAVGGAYYITVITWSVYYLFNSFQSPLPWVGCSQTWNSDSTLPTIPSTIKLYAEKEASFEFLLRLFRLFQPG